MIDASVIGGILFGIGCMALLILIMMHVTSVSCFRIRQGNSRFIFGKSGDPARVATTLSWFLQVRGWLLSWCR
jgi:hypothetical protein